MPLILDTYNILHVTGVLPPELAGIEIPGLIELIGRSRYAGEQALLVCDGMPPKNAPQQRQGVIRILYSGPRRSADDQIRELVVRSTAPRRIVLVSSDHAVQRHARKRRCRVLDAETFLQQLADDAGHQSQPREGDDRPATLSSSQVDAWTAVFGIDETALRDLDEALPAELAEKARSTPVDPETGDPASPPKRQTSDDRDGAALLPEELIEEARRMLEDDTG